MTPERLLQDYRASSSPPIVYLKLNEEINHSDSSLTRIGKIISEDSSLSARLLKLVNSAFYGFPQRIGTISEAVFLVGSVQVRDLALVTTLMSTFKGIPEDVITTEQFWMHSLATGTGCKVIAELTGQSDLERYFLLGVLHDIGRIVLFSTQPVLSQKMLKRAIVEKVSLTTAERDELGFTHADIGKALAEMWRLPSYLQEVTLYHHQPEKAVHYPLETSVVHSADVLAHALRFGASGEPCMPVLNKNSWERLKIPFHGIPPMMDRITKETEAVMWLTESSSLDD
ncbi:MAG: HDOD domain-containing protein [Bacteroidetes bacterium]|nr:HDOD domain-containing protein [Bacteroidota bacterium]